MSAINLAGDDLAAYNKALDLKNQGVKQFQQKNKDEAKKLMHEALDEMKKIQDRSDKEVGVLQGNICQNISLIHKQSEEFVDSLKMSE